MACHRYLCYGRQHGLPTVPRDHNSGIIADYNLQNSSRAGYPALLNRGVAVVIFRSLQDLVRFNMSTDVRLICSAIGRHPVVN